MKLAPSPLRASYALWLVALALLGATLLAVGNDAAAQSTGPSFGAAQVTVAVDSATNQQGEGRVTWIAGTALDATGVNRLPTFPTATGGTGTITYTLTADTTRGVGTIPPGLTFNGSATPRPTLTGMPPPPRASPTRTCSPTPPRTRTA